MIKPQFSNLIFKNFFIQLKNLTSLLNSTFIFRSNLDDTCDEDIEEPNLYEDIKSNDFQKENSDVNTTSAYRFQESFINTEQ